MINIDIDALLNKHDLVRIKPVLERYILPCVAFDLRKSEIAVCTGSSKVGGNPDLPEEFEWPQHNHRPLDFLAQIDLAEVANANSNTLLPQSGLLSFFYDLETQPWGFDPKDKTGSFVHYADSSGTTLKSTTPPSSLDVEMAISEHHVTFRSHITVPSLGSIDYDSFSTEVSFTDDESERFWEFVDEVGSLNHLLPEGYGGHHHLMGHSENVQGDMQTEAQLASNGIYCGTPEGYQDPRVESLLLGAHDWILLLQLDSDTEFMWGDAGMLYFWIKRGDLQRQNFGNVWMILQCG